MLERRLSHKDVVNRLAHPQPWARNGCGLQNLALRSLRSFLAMYQRDCALPRKPESTNDELVDPGLVEL